MKDITPKGRISTDLLTLNLKGLEAYLGCEKITLSEVQIALLRLKSPGSHKGEELKQETETVVRWKLWRSFIQPPIRSGTVASWE